MRIWGNLSSVLPSINYTDVQSLKFNDMRKIYLFGFMAFAFTFFGLIDGSAQTASLKGVVMNSDNGEKLPAAQIILKTNTGLVLKQQIGLSAFGEYELDSIEAGVYTLEVKCQGFATRTFKNFEIYPEHILEKNINLKAEFSRFSKSKVTASHRPNYDEKEKSVQYMMYGGLAIFLFSTLALR